jgi:hypothetical protein
MWSVQGVFVDMKSKTLQFFFNHKPVGGVVALPHTTTVLYPAVSMFYTDQSVRANFNAKVPPL